MKWRHRAKIIVWWVVGLGVGFVVLCVVVATVSPVKTTPRPASTPTYVIEPVPTPVIVRQTVPAKQKYITVTVGPGDTLWNLAAQYEWHEICTINRAVIGPNCDSIRAGEKLKIPVVG